MAGFIDGCCQDISRTVEHLNRCVECFERAVFVMEFIEENKELCDRINRSYEKMITDNSWDPQALAKACGLTIMLMAKNFGFFYEKSSNEFAPLTHKNYCIDGKTGWIRLQVIYHPGHLSSKQNFRKKKSTRNVAHFLRDLFLVENARQYLPTWGKVDKSKSISTLK